MDTEVLAMQAVGQSLALLVFVSIIGAYMLVQSLKDWKSRRKMQREYDDWKSRNPAGRNPDGTLGFDHFRIPHEKEGYFLIQRDGKN